MAQDYHVGWWAFLLVITLACAGLLACRQLRPGAPVIFCFLLVAALLTFQHPMTKWRFLHSWIAVLWLAAAVGLAQILAIIGRRSSWIRNGLGAAALLAITVLSLPQMLQLGHAQEGGIKPQLPSHLEITETYLPDLTDSRQATILANVQTCFALRWTYWEAAGHARPLQMDIKGYPAPPESRQQVLNDWLNTTRADSVVLINIPPGSPYYQKNDIELDLTPVRTFLAGQDLFARGRLWTLPHGETVELWKRR